MVLPLQSINEYCIQIKLFCEIRDYENGDVFLSLAGGSGGFVDVFSGFFIGVLGVVGC
jgi:hypothetical protein